MRLNFFIPFLLSIISVPTLCVVLTQLDVENGKIWKEIYQEYGTKMESNADLFTPICASQKPKSNLELFNKMENMQTFLWKLANVITKMPLPLNSNHHQQQQGNQILISQRKVEHGKMVNHEYKSDEGKLQEILKKFSHFNIGQMEFLHQIMGQMEKIKTMFNQKEKLMELFHKLQDDLKTILDKEKNQYLELFPHPKMDFFSIIKNGAELIILQFNGGNECKNGDEKKAKHNQQNTFRLLYLFTDLKETDFMQIPKRKGDRRRRRRKRQFSLPIILVIAAAFIFLIGVVCFYINKIPCCNEKD